MKDPRNAHKPDTFFAKGQNGARLLRILVKLMMTMRGKAVRMGTNFLVTS